MELLLDRLTKQYGSKIAVDCVSATLKPGVYGLLGANGAGKSTFLKLLSGEIEPSSGEILISKGERLSVLNQNQNAYDNYTVLDTVMHGHERLMQIMKEKDELYAKPDFSDEDGIRAGELENEFMELNGWEAEGEVEESHRGKRGHTRHFRPPAGRQDAPLP